MAGVGFELKKLFNDKSSYVSMVKAYSVTTIVTEGPMVLSILMLFILRYIIKQTGGTYEQQEIFLITLTYIMMFSMIMASPFLLLITRYISDCIYKKKHEEILPTFYGVSVIVLLLGVPLVFCFLWKLEIGWIYKFLSLIQFAVLMLMWIQIAFLSALKRYIKILKGFFVAFVVAVLAALVGVIVGVTPYISALGASTLGYMMLFIIFMLEMIYYYPTSEEGGHIFEFIKSLDKHGRLVIASFCMMLGLFAHNLVIWTGPFHNLVLGKMNYCMMYDIPAFYACLSITPMMVKFTVSLEVNFYQKYKIYFSNVLYGGRLKDINQAASAMKKVLLSEIIHMLQMQVGISIFFITFGASILSRIGVDVDMMGIFRILCFGYCLYGLGKCITIILLYFDDQKGALWVSFIFLISSLILTKMSLKGGISWYGLGFVGASLLMVLVGLGRLRYYTEHLEYYIFCKQPIIKVDSRGFFTKLVERFELT